MVGGPTGCAGASNPSGWMNAEQFYQFLIFFQSHAHASKENPILLILDNHESHLSIRGLDYCKENGIVVLSLPPHTSHKLQPLDRSIFRPLKTAVNTQCDNWVTNNPGCTMTIYHIPAIVKIALPSATTTSNIVSGFECTGICPLNTDKFQDYEYMPSLTTDRSMPSTSTDDAALVDDEEGFSDASFMSVAAYEETVADIQSQSTPLQSEAEEASNMSTVSTVDNLSAEFLDTTLEDLRPFAKAPPRKQSNRGRKKRRSEILTSSPVMAQLREEQAASEKKGKRALKKPTVTKPAKKAKTTSTVVSSGIVPLPIKLPDATNTRRSQRLQDPKGVNVTTLCCVCDNNFSPSERFKLCLECRRKAHVNCVRTSDDLFTCRSCFSDADNDESETEV